MPEALLWALVVGVILHLLWTDRSNSPRWQRWIPPLFFLSGFPALAYQIVWQRALFVVFGSNIQSVTIIVTIFILGLGIGSLASGWWSARTGSPLLLFGALEVAIGAFGVISMPLFKFVAEHVDALSTPGTMILAVALLIPPTMLMGATLPMLVSHLSRRDPVQVGRSVGRLYFVNTLGSAIACFICAQFAMKALGEHKMTLAAACVNFAIGGFVLIRRGKEKSEKDTQAEPEGSSPRAGGHLKFGSSLALAFVTGFIALAYEMVWYRLYSFADGGRAPGFAYVLGAYLGGLAYGSLVAEVKCRRAEESNSFVRLSVIGRLVIGFNLLAFLVAPALSLATRTLGAGIGLFLIAIAAGFLGSVFPLIANASIVPGKGAGKGLGRLYFANMLGAALGSFVIGYLVLDLISVRAMAEILVLGGIACGITVMANSARPISLVALSLSLAAVIIALAPWLFNHIYEKLLYKNLYEPGTSFKYLIENRNGVIAVTGSGTVYGGGVYDGVFNTQLINDTNGIIRCYAISSFHPSPKRVLVIGLSSGSWAQVIANHPLVEHLDVVEINPGYLELIPQYKEVATLLRNPKVVIHIDDGRRWLRRNPEKKFDLIVMNTTYFWRAHSTNLLSVEYLQLIRQHLMNGGIFFYNTTTSGEVQLTGATVFPYALRVANFLAVSDSPIVIDKGRLRTVLLNYKVDGHPVLDGTGEDQSRELAAIMKMLDPVNYGEDKEFLTVETGDSIRRRYADKRVITDDNMGSEW